MDQANKQNSEIQTKSDPIKINLNRSEPIINTKQNFTVFMNFIQTEPEPESKWVSEKSKKFKISKEFVPNLISTLICI